MGQAASDTGLVIVSSNLGSEQVISQAGNIATDGPERRVMGPSGRGATNLPRHLKLGALR
jgi:hypothetical protein